MGYRAVFHLACRFWNDIEAGWILLRAGFILNCMMVERDAVETMALARYLKGHPEDAHPWSTANEMRDRRQFDLQKLYSQVEGGDFLKSTWDTLSSYIHPNELAQPVFSRSREVFGYDFCIGSICQPSIVTGKAEDLLLLSAMFVRDIYDWFHNDVLFPTDYSPQLETLEESCRNAISELEAKTTTLEAQFDERLRQTKLTRPQILSLLNTLETALDWEEHLRQLLPPDYIP